MSLPDARDRLRAASDLDTNLVVTAGAGTGKTSLVVERLLHHLLLRGTPIERIAAITFTRKAAAEMRERLEDALERVSTLLAATTPPSLDAGQEADRVVARLDDSTRQLAAERARRALECLDDAGIGTIHGIAGDILRRHHHEAGVDIGFAIDEDGSAFAEVFSELWQRFLEEDTCVETRAGAWRKVLDRLSLTGLETLATRLCAFRYPLASLRGESVDAQKLHAASIADDLAAEMLWIREHVLVLDGVNRRLAGSVDIADAMLSELREGRLTVEKLKDVGLPEKPSLGKNVDAEPDDARRMTRRVKNAFVRLRSAAAIDLTLATESVALLLPFVKGCRDEFLRRGCVSHDGLIVLCRDLLRDYPNARREEAARLDHVLVDEFQDTDPVQYEIVFFLGEAPADDQPASRDAFAARLKPGKLFIVGDAKQSIYRFRGADIDAYRRAVDAVKREGGDVLTLRANFRSVPRLMNPLNDLFEGLFGDEPDENVRKLDPDFDALSPQREGLDDPAIEIWSVGEPGQRAPERRHVEGETVAAWIRAGLDGQSFRARDVAILLRALGDVDPLLRALRRRHVPYVVDSGRGFYTRYEVELFLSVLRLVVTPADSVPLIACLRSTLCGVPDRELHLHALETEDAERRWRLDAEVSPESCPRLAQAMAFLRAFVERHRHDSIDTVARAALDETPLRISMAASHEGAQKVANLEKAVRRIVELASDGSSSTDEILQRIEDEEGRDRGEGDSPLADESLDAVTIVTVHGAKGLEWPIVILPDLVRGGHPRQTGVSVELAPPAGLALRVSKNLLNAAWMRHESLESFHDRSERKRLFYVATTRARDRLILVAGAPARGETPWVEPLSHWGYHIDPHEFPDVESFHRGQVIHRRVREAPAAKKPDRDSNDDSSLIEAVHRFTRARDAILSAAATGPTLRAISIDGERPSETPHAMETESSTGPGDRRVARAVGSALHHLLEVWNREEPTWLFEHTEAAAGIAAAREGVDVDVVAREMQQRLESSETREMLGALGRLDLIAREMPVLWVDDDGVVWDGIIDGVVRAGEDVEVIDYKASERSPEELAAEYAPQLDRYTEGLRRALGLDARPKGRVLAIRRGPPA